MSVSCWPGWVVSAVFVPLCALVEPAALSETVAPGIGLLLLSTTFRTTVVRPGSGYLPRPSNMRRGTYSRDGANNP